MKRAVLAMLVVCAALAVVFAQSEIRSENAVGYVKVTFEKNSYKLVNMGFDSIDGSDLKIEDVFGDQLPSSTSLSIWDRNSQTYSNYIYNTFAQWGPRDDQYTITKGLGVFVLVPGTAPSNQYTVYLMGEVPDNAGETNDVMQGYTGTGYPYPVQIAFTNTQIAQSLPANSVVHFWDDTWISYTKNAFQGWQTDRMLSPGEGFFIEKFDPGTMQYSEIKPYTWP